MPLFTRGAGAVTQFNLQALRFHAKNDARMKYFKVRSSGDIDGRIGDAGQAAIAGIQMGYKSDLIDSIWESKTIC